MNNVHIKDLDDKTIADFVRNFAAQTTIAKTKTFALPMGEFPLVAFASFITYGAQRKFNDAVGGADKDAATKVALAEAMIAEFKKGIVAKRREGTGATEEILVARQLMRDILRANGDWATVKDMEPDARNAKLDELCEVNADALAPAIAAELAERRAKAEKAAKLAATISVNL